MLWLWFACCWLASILYVCLSGWLCCLWTGCLLNLHFVCEPVCVSVLLNFRYWFATLRGCLYIAFYRYTQKCFQQIGWPCSPEWDWPHFLWQTSIMLEAPRSINTAVGVVDRKSCWILPSLRGICSLKQGCPSSCDFFPLVQNNSLSWLRLPSTCPQNFWHSSFSGKYRGLENVEQTSSNLREWE